MVMFTASAAATYRQQQLFDTLNKVYPSTLNTR
jgi:hypothetical protein